MPKFYMRHDGKILDEALKQIYDAIPHETEGRITKIQLQVKFHWPKVFVQDCIRHLRQQGVPICNDDNGFFIAESADTLRNEITTMRGKLESHMRTINAMEKCLKYMND